MRNNFASCKLATMMLLTVNNMPKTFNKAAINVTALNNKGYSSFYKK